jgi:fibronectin-binding autotransporter adhesin
MKVSPFNRFLLSLPVLLAASASVCAQNVWTGATSGVINVSTNYQSGASVANDGNPSAAFVFGRVASTRRAITLPGEFKANQLQFESNGGGGFTLGGGFLNFVGGSNGIFQNSSQDVTISSGIKVSDGPLTLGGTGNGLITISGTTGNDFGGKGITKSGTSAFLFTQSLSSTGSLTINGGTLAFTGSGNIATAYQLRGGVIATNGTFSRALGTGGTNVNFGTGGGGFAAYGGNLTVSTALGTWASSANSLANNTSLILGSNIANGVVTLSQALNLGNAARTIQVVDNANSPNDWSVLSGILSNGGLTINGSGRLILSNTNTFTGVTSINGGTLSVATIGNGGVAGNLGQAAIAAGNLVLGGGTLQYTGATASTNRNFTLTATTSSSIEVSQAATVLTMTGANTATTGQLTKTGAGTLIFSGNHLSTGGFTLAAGTLRATTNAGALGNGGLTLSGGVLELANNTGLNYGRNTTVNGNTTILSDRLAAGAGVNHTLGTLSLGAQTLTVGAGTNVNSGTAEVTFGNTTFTSAGSILANSGSRINLSGTMGGDFTKTLGGTGELISSGAISGAAGVSKTDLGTLILTGANTFSGQLTVANGTLSISTINNASANGTLGNSANAVLLGSSGNIGTLGYTGATASTTKPFSAVAGGTAALNVTNAGTTLTYSASLVGSGNITLGGAGNHVVGGGIGGAVGSLTKNGAGALTLSGLGHGGGFAINQGRLNVNNDSAFGNSTSLSLASGVTLDNTSGATVNVTSSGLIKTLGSSLNFVGTGDLSLGTGTTNLSSNITFDINAGNLTLAGDVTGNFGITKVGAGTLTLGGLSGSSSYTGNTFINAGELSLTGTPTFANNTEITVANGAFLRVGSGSNLSNVVVSSRPEGLIFASAGPIQMAMMMSSGGTLTDSSANINGQKTISSGVEISAAADYFGSDPGSEVADRIILSDNSTIRVTNAFSMSANKGMRISSGVANIHADANLVMANRISGNGGLVKRGAAQLTISGLNDYRGATRVETGKLVIANTGTLGSLSSVSVDSGSEIVVDGAVNGSLFVDEGATLSGSGSIAGPTAVSGIHSPGNSPGIQTFNNNLDYQEGSSITWELNANASTQDSPPIFDQIIVNGNLEFVGSTSLNLVFAFSGSTVDWRDSFWNSNQSWTLFDVSGTTTGAEYLTIGNTNFTDVWGASLSNARSASNFSLSLQGRDVLLSYTAVPESSVTLLGGLSALLLLRRRRHQ